MKINLTHVNKYCNNRRNGKNKLIFQERSTLVINNASISKARFELTAVKPEQYPASSLPEFALIGRSNVGKSSIINSLLNRKGIARVSSTPGKTREINFYNIDDKIYFVDLQGYGYANVSKEKKSTWGDIIEIYLTTRLQLRALIMLVDIRHKPSDYDKVMFDWLMAKGMPFLIVATKKQIRYPVHR